MEAKTNLEKKEKAIQRKNGLLTALTYLLLSIWAVVVLFPFYWMVLTSFKSYGAYNGERTPVFFTLSPTLENYENAFTAVPLLGYLLNTLIFSVITTAAMVVVSTLAAYAFARLKFKGKNLVFGLFLSMMMIPTELVVITNFVTITNWDMRNSFLGLILPSITSVFYIYLLKENFEQVPEELYKAAKVDGTSDLKYLWKVMIPICKPTLVTITILKLIECWNSYVWPRLITDDPAYYLVCCFWPSARRLWRAFPKEGPKDEKQMPLPGAGGAAVLLFGGLPRQPGAGGLYRARQPFPGQL